MSTKITALPASAGLVLTDIFPVVDDPGGVPVTQKATFAQLQTLLATGGPFVLKAGDTMTGALAMPDGTAALPALTFSGDTDTGTYRIGANVLGASVGGVRITSWNSVGFGVGTDAATFRLEVVGTSSIAARRIGINGVSMLYLADQTPFSNSMFVGNGGGSLSNTAGLEGQFNVGIGIGALLAVTTGFFNVGVGSNAVRFTTTGTQNTGVGINAVFSNVTGVDNTGVGVQALFLATGSRGTAIGVNALGNVTTGVENVGIGATVLLDVNTGANNTGIGFNTGRGITTGSNNTIIGGRVTGLAAALTGTIILATGAGTIRFYSDSAGLSGIATAVPNSTLHVQGSLALAYVAKTAVYTATVSDYTIDCTANTFDVDLPTAVGITGRIYVIKNSGAGVITIDPDGAETIDGAASQAVVAGASYTIQSTGANWIII